MMKLAALILAGLMSLTACAPAAAPEPQASQEPVVSLTGTVNQVTEEGLLLDTESGPVLVLTNSDTVLEGFAALSDLAPGRMAEVLYNGMMTRSIPAQITAQRITSVQLAGTVTEHMESAFLMDTPSQGPVQVNLQAGATLPQ
ncbi:MAG: hypothetical protein IJ461_06220, partial [Clostridia bacterium]|nr:hypothetical protein [Clostridia bacterium]